MPDWTKSMQQSYEYYTVEPTTLADVKRLDTVKSASFTRDIDTETLGSATIDATHTFGESYVRGYLKTIQNGVTEKHALGTVLVQTPSSTFNGMYSEVSMDAYTPLIELKEKCPPLGYTLRKGTRIMAAAYKIITENTRVPVTQIEPLLTEEELNGKDEDEEEEEEDVENEGGEVEGGEVEGGDGAEEAEESPYPVLHRDFVANVNDTWLSFVVDLIKTAKYELGLDAMGHIIFVPIQDLESMRPVWTYDDGNSSILYPEISMNHDLYGIPNVVEVIYSYGTGRITARAENNDPNSPTSIVNRGRQIIRRETNPNLAGYATEEQVQDYAERLLKSLSTVEYTVKYTHAYCPVRVGDCVRLNYEKAGMINIKAKVISQNIKCDLGCSVSETAVFTTKLWR